MRLVPREVARRASTNSNAFLDIVTPEMLSLLKRSPGIQYQIFDDDGKPLVLNAKALHAFRQACKRPYRVTSRAAGTRKSARLVWICNDPGYWVRRDKARGVYKEEDI